VAFFVHTSEPSSGELEQLQGRGVQAVSGAVARLVIEDGPIDRRGDDRRSSHAMGRRVHPAGEHAHPDGLLSGLGCQVDEAGFAIVDASGRTSTVGVWAAGNVVDARLQVISSAGAGSAAAIAINADLVQEDVQRAVLGPVDPVASHS